MTVTMTMQEKQGTMPLLNMKSIFKSLFLRENLALKLLIPRAPPTKSDYDIYKIKDVKECLFNMVYNNNGANDNLGCLHVV